MQENIKQEMYYYLTSTYPEDYKFKMQVVSNFVVVSEGKDIGVYTIRYEDKLYELSCYWGSTPTRELVIDSFKSIEEPVEDLRKLTQQISDIQKEIKRIEATLSVVQYNTKDIDISKISSNYFVKHIECLEIYLVYCPNDLDIAPLLNKFPNGIIW